jgi:2-amino-1-hydroxyethylphosphonate dioxygenase (glycine-forming)
MAVDGLFALYDDFGVADYIGEPVSQREHMLQAASLAARAGERPALVLAALLHDVGHLVALRDGSPQTRLGANGHEELGARAVLEAGLPGEIADLVRSHVSAKRYLVAADDRYRATLSKASTMTLELQGGPMSDVEAARFCTSEMFSDALRLRGYDELAKEVSPDPGTLPLEYFKGIARALAYPERRQRSIQAHL